jgi:hypothetical protein
MMSSDCVCRPASPWDPPVLSCKYSVKPVHVRTSDKREDTGRADSITMHITESLGEQYTYEARGEREREREREGRYGAMVAPGKHSAGAFLGCLLQWSRSETGMVAINSCLHTVH